MADAQQMIFIGYRRDDTADVSGRVFDRLHAAFGAGQVFKDVDNLPIGSDFGAHILTILPRCRVFLAMIGPGWSSVEDEGGARRLENAKDWVRIELETALATPGLQVVPVLVNGAPMPREEDLPPSLKPLVRLNAASVRRDPDFHKDMDKLIHALQSGLTTGRVAVEVPAQQVLSGSVAAWKVIESSLDPHDYLDFERHFPGTPEVMLASRCRRQLEAWAATNKSSIEAIKVFLATRPFGALADVAAETAATVQRAARSDFQLSVREQMVAREAAAHASYKFHHDMHRAHHAALGGKPVEERIFRLDLPGVAGWPTPEVVVIPPGSFLMGSPPSEKGRSEHEGPQREVQIGYAFAVGRCSVSFAEWDAALASGVPLTRPNDQGWGRGPRPVINVSWEDAQAYLAWLNDVLGRHDRPAAWRLLSEAEWEYAARAATTTPFSFGKTISTSQVNYDGQHTYGSGSRGEFRRKTTPVGTFEANAFGLHDMHGNVWEWVEDCYEGSYSAGQPSDGRARASGRSSLRVIRGGSWGNEPGGLRSASRNGLHPTTRYDHVGFRVARTLSTS